jgi:hypothetical protein
MQRSDPANPKTVNGRNRLIDAVCCRLSEMHPSKNSVDWSPSRQPFDVPQRIHNPSVRTPQQHDRPLGRWEVDGLVVE